MRNNCDKKCYFKQSSKDGDNIYREIAGFDTSCEEFMDLCRKARKKGSSYLYTARSKKRKIKKKFKIWDESNNTIIATLKRDPFNVA